MEIDRGETAPVYDNGAAELSVGYPVELTGVIRAGTAGRVEEGLADYSLLVKYKMMIPIHTYLPIIFFSAEVKSFQLNTLTSFSIFLGFGGGNPMMSLKNSSDSGFAFETVKGLKPSKFLRILFFSSTVNLAATNCSNKEIVSTLVTKKSCGFSLSHSLSQTMQLMQILFGGRSSADTGLKVVVIVLPD